MNLIEMLDQLPLQNVSDIFLNDGQIVHGRVCGKVSPLGKERVSAGDVAVFRERVLSAELKAVYSREHSVDLAWISPGKRRFRINFFSASSGEGAALRPVCSGGDLYIDQLGLPQELQMLADAPRGMILISGATGSGKSTTLAAVINHINRSSARHVLTLEDPIEFFHAGKESLINQREIGTDSSSFDRALRDALRENPDVIVIGEMRDPETMQTAINAALTGHLVISTVHTGSAVLAVERIINLFPQERREQCAVDLGNALLGIFSQRLLVRRDGGGMIPAVEYLPGTPMVRKLISDRNFSDLEKVLRDGGTSGMVNFSRAVFELYRRQLISYECALENAGSPGEFKLLKEGMKSGVDTFKKVYGSGKSGAEVIDLGTLLYTAVRMGSSDLILTVDTPPAIRINGLINSLDLPPLQPEDTASLLYSILTPHQRITFEEKRDLDFALSVNLKKNEDGSLLTGRFRINAFHQRGAVGVVARVISDRIPAPDELGIPAVLRQLAGRSQGLILITGPTGSGKTTTVASLIDGINRSKPVHIITIEDPIEYVHKNICSIVEQREVYADTPGFSSALKYALRQDPDVIFVGEMRDTETMAAALTAAETGHLVLATVHTNSASQTIDRIVDSFPDHQQNQIRLQLSGVLLGVVSQRLLPRLDKQGRAAAFEIMMGTPPIQALIRDGKTHLLGASIETGFKDGMITMEKALNDLYENNVIAREEIEKMLGFQDRRSPF